FHISFSINCDGHMVRAGTANSIELAKQEMEVIVKYAEDHHMTSGYTSVLYNSPSEDVGYWYNNMKSSRDELNKLKPDASDLEKSNMLIKLRESVVHHHGDGVSTTAPSGIEIFPNNVGYAVFGFISLI